MMWSYDRRSWKKLQALAAWSKRVPYDEAAACRARDEPETLVGFRRTGDDRAVVNPPDKSTKRVWDYYDMLVVLAED